MGKIITFKKTGTRPKIAQKGEGTYEPATNHCLLFDGGWYRSSHAYVQRWPGGSGRRYHSLCSRSQGTDGCGYTPLPKGILPPEIRGGRVAAGGACGMGRRGLFGRGG